MTVCLHLHRSPQSPSFMFRPLSSLMSPSKILSSQASFYALSTALFSPLQSLPHPGRFIFDCLAFHHESRPNIFNLLQRAQSHITSDRKRPKGAESTLTRGALKIVPAVIFAGWIMLYLYALPYPVTVIRVIADTVITVQVQNKQEFLPPQQIW